MGYVVTNVLIAVACVLFVWKNHIPRDAPGFSLGLFFAGAAIFIALGRVVQLIRGRDRPAAQQMQRYVVAIGVWSALACLVFWLSDSEGLGILLNVENPYGHIPLDLVLKLRWAVVALSFPLPILIAYRKGKRALAHPPAKISPSGALPIDPNKWALDPDTGEYLKITYSGKEGRLVSTKTYAERSTERLKAVQHRETWKPINTIALIALGVGLVALFAPAIFFIERSLDEIVGAFVVTLLALGMVVTSAAELSFDGKLEDVGPKPVPLRTANPDDMADFKNQKALGAAGVASQAEVHQALARKSAPPAPPRRFED